MFCPKCGALLLPKKNKKKNKCSCGHTVEMTDINIKISDEIEDKKDIEVLDEMDNIKTLPLTDADCEKCGHDKARFWTTQTRASDEPETKFLRCEKCHHVWRDYS